MLFLRTLLVALSVSSIFAYPYCYRCASNWFDGCSPANTCLRDNYAGVVFSYPNRCGYVNGCLGRITNRYVEVDYSLCSSPYDVQYLQ
uniref:Uncharacterized protein n=1 Tax=Megaselia scalaris TaxID=36166 RepID=T1H1S6_MEGSC